VQPSSMSNSTKLQAVPVEATGDEAERIYNKIIDAITSIDADKVGKFNEMCKEFGQCSAADASAGAQKYNAWLCESFGKPFSDNLLPDISRLIADESKRQILLQEADLLATVPTMGSSLGTPAWMQSSGGVAATSTPATPDSSETPVVKDANTPGATGPTDDGPTPAQQAAAAGGALLSSLWAMGSSAAKQAVEGSKQMTASAKAHMEAQKKAKEEAEAKLAAERHAISYLTEPQRAVTDIVDMLSQLDVWAEHDAENGALQRCTQYVQGLCDMGEKPLKAWIVKDGVGGLFTSEWVLVLTSMSYYKVKYDPLHNKIASYVKSDMTDVINIRAHPVRNDAMVIYSYETAADVKAQKSIFAIATSAVKGAASKPVKGEKDSEFYVQAPPEMEMGKAAIVQDLVAGFQAVHRRFVSAPESVETISKDQVETLKKEHGLLGSKGTLFSPKESANDADGDSDATQPAILTKEALQARKEAREKAAAEEKEAKAKEEAEKKAADMAALAKQEEEQRKAFLEAKRREATERQAVEEARWREEVDKRLEKKATEDAEALEKSKQKQAAEDEAKAKLEAQKLLDAQEKARIDQEQAALEEAQQRRQDELNKKKAALFGTLLADDADGDGDSKLFGTAAGQGKAIFDDKEKAPLTHDTHPPEGNDDTATPSSLLQEQSTHVEEEENDGDGKDEVDTQSTSNQQDANLKPEQGSTVKAEQDQVEQDVTAGQGDSDKGESEAQNEGENKVQGEAKVES